MIVINKSVNTLKDGKPTAFVPDVSSKKNYMVPGRYAKSISDLDASFEISDYK